VEDGLCVVDGCDRPVLVKARGWCSLHYQRWQKGQPVDGPPQRLRDRLCDIQGCGRKHMARGLCVSHYTRMAKDQALDAPIVDRTDHPDRCFVDGCGAPYLARGMCKLHYDRWNRGAALEPVERAQRVCDIQGCGRPFKGNGMCGMHYQRWKSRGEAGSPDPVELRQQDHWHWKGDAVGYHAVHVRLRVQRGLARLQQCPCGAPAAQWALDNDSPRATTGADGMRYSLDLDDYIAMCASCHRRMDREWTAQQAG